MRKPKIDTAENDRSRRSSSMRLLEGIQPITMSMRRRTLIFVVAVINVFAQYLYFTISLPILANEIIEVRGLSANTAGIAFAALCLSLSMTLISTPKTAPYLTIRQAIIISTVFALPSTPFYILKLDNTTFIVYTIVSRILQGIAIGISDVRFLDIMTLVFPDKMALVTSFYEIAFSGSLMIGPSLGGYLYHNYGFWAPLNLATIITISSCFAAIACTFFLDLESNNSGAENIQPSLKDMFYFPLIIIGVSVMSVISIAVTILESFLSNFLLNKYEKSEAVSGWVMTTAGLLYTVATFVSGIVGSRKPCLKYLILGGLLLMGVSCTLMGEDFGPLKKIGFYWPSAMYSCIEVGSGLTQVAVLPLLVEHYKKRVSLPDNVASCHMGGFYSSSFFIGSFIGPIIGGWILKYASYRLCCTISGALLFFEFILVLTCHLKDDNLLSPWKKRDLVDGLCNN